MDLSQLKRIKNIQKFNTGKIGFSTVPNIGGNGIDLTQKNFNILLENANKKQWKIAISDKDKKTEENYTKISQ